VAPISPINKKILSKEKMISPTSTARSVLKKFIKVLFSSVNLDAAVPNVSGIYIFSLNSMMDGIFLLLGSNLGDRSGNIERATKYISNLIGPILKSSSTYETMAWGIEDQQDFLNQVLKISTSLPPKQLLEQLLQIEEAMGRIRQVKWGARLIDLDILFYNDMIIESENLIIPHPGIPDRRFTLVPLAEIAGVQIHPKIGLPIDSLLSNCTDSLEVRMLEPK